MSFRIAVLLVALVALATGWYFLNDLMATQAWVSNNGEEWIIEGHGWGMLFHAWPVVLGGALIGGFIVDMILGAFLAMAEDADHQQAVKRLTQAKIQAESTAATAEERAQALFSEKHAALQDEQQQVNQLRQQLEAFARNCQTEVNQANERAEQAKKRASDAEQRKNNAAGAAERRKRKLDRINQ